MLFNDLYFQLLILMHKNPSFSVYKHSYNRPNTLTYTVVWKQQLSSHIYTYISTMTACKHIRTSAGKHSWVPYFFIQIFPNAPPF